MSALTVLRWRGWLVLLAGLVLLGCSNSAEPAPETVVYHEYKNLVAFDMLYPEQWQYQVLTEGLLVFAQPADLNINLDEPAPSIVVYRQPPDVRFTVSEKFEHYLESGPLGSGYTLVREMTPIPVDEYEGFKATATRDADGQKVTTYMVTTQARSGFYYVFSATSPTDVWDSWWPIFEIMLASVEFNE